MAGPSTSTSSEELAAAKAKFDSLPPVVRNMLNPETIAITGEPYSSTYTPSLPSTTTIWMKKSVGVKHMHAVLRMLLPGTGTLSANGGVLYLKINSGQILAAGARVNIDLLLDELRRLHSGTYRKYQQPGD